MTIATVLMMGISGAVVVAGLLTAVDVTVTPSFSISLATVQSVSAKAWLVFDVEQNEVLYAHNETEVLPIASITKLPAAKVFSDTRDIWATTSINWADLNHEGRAGKLAYGEEYRYHTLFFPLLIESSNDAAGVLERASAKLVDDMNTYARRLSLTDVAFADASGLSNNNQASALAVKELLRNIYLTSRHLTDITSLKSYLTPGKGWLNNNPFVNDPTYQGGKHGYTNAAGYTTASLFSETLQDNKTRTLGYVLLGSRNLEYDMSLLRNHVKAHLRYE